jgi:hypothetical protein
MDRSSRGVHAELLFFPTIIKSVPAGSKEDKVDSFLHAITMIIRTTCLRFMQEIQTMLTATATATIKTTSPQLSMIGTM